VQLTRHTDSLRVVIRLADGCTLADLAARRKKPLLELLA